MVLLVIDSAHFHSLASHESIYESYKHPYIAVLYAEIIEEQDKLRARIVAEYEVNWFKCCFQPCAYFWCDFEFFN